MNKAYKTIWSESSGTYVAVSENVKAKGKRSSSAKLLSVAAAVAATFAVSGAASALEVPVGEDIVFLGDNGTINFGSGGSITGLTSLTVTSLTVNGDNVLTSADLSSINSDIDSLESIVGNATGGLVKDVADINTSLTNLGVSEAQGGIKYFRVNSQGVDAEASGSNAVAIGPNSKASNSSSVALGNNTAAAGSSSTALGSNAKVLSGSNAVALGSNATVNLLGNSQGNNSIAIGNSANAAGNTALAVGFQAKSSALHSAAFGSGAEVEGQGSLALGYSAKAGQNGTNLGHFQNAIAIGTRSQAIANNAIALGTDAKANNNGVIAIGEGAKALGGSAVVMGKSAVAFGQGTSIGTSAGLNNTAATTGIGHTLIGYLAGASMKDSSAGTASVGYNTGVGDNSLSGSESYGYGENAALGSRSGRSMKGDRNTVIGSYAGMQMEGDHNATLGYAAGQSMKGHNNVAIGTEAGKGLEVDNTVALGAKTLANFKYDVALGAESTTEEAVGTISVNVQGIEYAFAGTTPRGTVSVGSAGKERTITNVAAGRVSAVSTDAINGSQLFAVSDVLGNTVNFIGLEGFADGTYGITFNGNTYTSLGDVLNSLHWNIDVGDGSGPGGSGGSSSGGSGSGGDKTGIHHGDTLTLVAGDNIVIEKTPDGGSGDTDITIGLAPDITVDNVVINEDLTVIGNTDLAGGTLIVEDNSITVGSDTLIDMGDNRVTNVADGVDRGDAVNKGQLDDTRDELIAKGLNFVGDDGQTVHRDLGQTLSITGGATGNLTSGNIGVVEDGAGGLSVQLAENIDLGSNGSVTMGDTTVNNSGIAIYNSSTGNTVSLSKDGLDNGGNRITNVAPGIDGTDAVNVDQLTAVNNNLQHQIDGNRHDIKRNNDRANAGIAAAMATAGLPQAYLPGKSMVAVAGGVWRGESGMAIGVSTVSENGKWVLKGSANTSGRGGAGGTIGAGYQW